VTVTPVTAGISALSTRTEERQIVRGRRERPRDRLPANETGLEAQPGRFSHGMWACILFVSSEAMFFLALFTTYFFLRGRVPEWEPIFQRCIDVCEKPHWNSVTPILGLPVPLVAINTAVLLASSVTMQLAVNAIKKGDRRGLINWLIPTVLMGVWFIAGQVYEYTKLGFLPDNSIFAAVFFTLTGFHGAHVTGGILMNALVLFRALRGQFSAQRHLAVEAASIYWHFVDVVWIGLFTIIYIVG
jgi:cytochrome c oxidase subunit 3